MTGTTTTIRIERDVHRRLAKLGEASGQLLIDVVRDAAQALERERFASTVIGEFELLRDDAVGWADYLADAELAVGDGVTE